MAALDSIGRIIQLNNLTNFSGNKYTIVLSIVRVT